MKCRAWYTRVVEGESRLMTARRNGDDRGKVRNEVENEAARNTAQPRRATERKGNYRGSKGRTI